MDVLKPYIIQSSKKRTVDKLAYEIDTSIKHPKKTSGDWFPKT
jgi:hypothetical protein